MSSGKFYQLECLDGHGRRFSFEQLKGKVVVVVNVASLCGFTPQYEEFEALYQKYKSDGLEILAFPCNQFGGQEPLDGEKLVEHCRRSFGVTFPIMEKVEVNGYGEHPVYRYIKQEKPGELGFKGVRWNFEKFVIDRRGNVVMRCVSAVTPTDMECLIERLLKQ